MSCKDDCKYRREQSPKNFKGLSFPKTSLCFVVAMCAGCSATTSPTFYPNEHYRSVGVEQASNDKASCMALADDYVKQPNKYWETSKSGAMGAAVGAGTGAVAGAIMKGNVGRSIGAGAAVGAIVSIVREASKQSERPPSYERFVEHCLRTKGYEVIGWE